MCHRFVTNVKGIVDATGSIGDIDFTGNPTYCDRKVKSKAETGKFTNTCPSTQPLASNNLERHLWDAVYRIEHHFSCRVFGFDQVNQVTTRVKSESFTGPCNIFADTFFALFQTNTKPYSLASVATMDEHQPRVQLLTIAGRRPTKACTSALALGPSLAES